MLSTVSPCYTFLNFMVNVRAETISNSLAGCEKRGLSHAQIEGVVSLPCNRWNKNCDSRKKMKHYKKISVTSEWNLNREQVKKTKVLQQQIRERTMAKTTKTTKRRKQHSWCSITYIYIIEEFKLINAITRFDQFKHCGYLLRMFFSQGNRVWLMNWSEHR